MRREGHRDRGTDADPFGVLGHDRERQERIVHRLGRPDAVDPGGFGRPVRRAVDARSAPMPASIFTRRGRAGDASEQGPAPVPSRRARRPTAAAGCRPARSVRQRDGRRSARRSRAITCGSSGTALGCTLTAAGTPCAQPRARLDRSEGANASVGCRRSRSRRARARHTTRRVCRRDARRATTKPSVTSYRRQPGDGTRRSSPTASERAPFTASSATCSAGTPSPSA